MEALSVQDIQRAIAPALAEDIGTGDITTLATVPASAGARAVMIAREELIASGLPVAEAVFQALAPSAEVTFTVQDGDRVKAGQAMLKVSGPARGLLSAERVALNFVQHLSGIATITRQFVDAIEGTRARVLDTRKTTPGLRRLEKYAVVCGGGHNHRLGLYDFILIKDNHLATLRGEEPNAVAAAIQRAHESYPGYRIEVEADNLEQVAQALEARADVILLDNMNLVQMRLAVQQARGRAETEASGGVNLASVRAIAETGVDYISVGALTHSARAVDIALDFEV